MSRPGQPPNRIGVCSWSLRARTPEDLARAVSRLGLGAVQLALDPILAAGESAGARGAGAEGGAWGEVRTVNALRSAGIEVVSGMIGMAAEDYSTLESIRRTGGVRVDANWGRNLRHADAAARLARRLGIPLVTFHAGFIPHEPSGERKVLIDRLRMIVDRFDDAGVRVAFETGQESAATLLGALEELNRPHAGVNFDPANMLLYGMGDPVAALDTLADRVVQVHIKDAHPWSRPGQWGTEVTAGTGSVKWGEFFGVLRARNIGADLLIEREGGVADDRREAEIAAAVGLLAAHGYRAGGSKDGRA